MGALNQPHWEAVPQGIQGLLADLGRLSAIKPFYLAGGTSIALRVGHRVSNDLDFFSETDSVDTPRREEIIAALQNTQRHVIVQRSAFTSLTLLADDHHISFFSYAYELVDTIDDLLGVRVAGLADVALMKLDAVINRSQRRDFIDLYVIAKQTPLETLLELGQRKYPHYRDWRMNVLEALTRFDGADEDVEPILLQSIQWTEVKEFFIDRAKRLGDRWFGLGR
jgi:hypothetical protein